MAAGQSPWVRAWVQPRLYAGFLRDDSAAEAAYAAMVVLYINETHIFTCYFYLNLVSTAFLNLLALDHISLGCNISSVKT